MVERIRGKLSDIKTLFRESAAYFDDDVFSLSIQLLLSKMSVRTVDYCWGSLSYIVHTKVGRTGSGLSA